MTCVTESAVNANIKSIVWNITWQNTQIKKSMYHFLLFTERENKNENKNNYLKSDFCSLQNEKKHNLFSPLDNFY